MNHSQPSVSLGGGAASYIARARSIAGGTGEATLTLHCHGRTPEGETEAGEPLLGLSVEAPTVQLGIIRLTLAKTREP